MLGSEELLLAGQDRTEDKLSKHSVCSRNTYPGDDRKEPGACLHSGADLQPNFSTHHTLLNPLKGRLKWKPCPLLLLLSWAALLHRLVLHQAKCSNPTSNILLFVFFFFLQHYCSTGKLVTRLHSADADVMHSLVTSLPILTAKTQYLSHHCRRNLLDIVCYCWLVCDISLTASCVGHHCKILLLQWSVGVCLTAVAMFIVVLSSLEDT